MLETFKTIAKGFDNTSRYLVLLATFFLPLSTVLMNVFFALTVICMLLGGRWQEKWNFVRYNPIAFWATFIFVLYALGMFYSHAAWHDRFMVLGKYHKLLFIPLLMPIFADEKMRDRTLKVFMISMVVVLIASYLHFFNILKVTGFGPGSVFKNHSTTNLLMAFAAFLWLHAVFSKTLFHSEYSRTANGICLLIALLMITNVLFLSNGRIGYLLITALLLLFGWQKKSWQGFVIALFASVALLVAAYFLSSSFKERTASLMTTQVTTVQDVSAQDRLTEAKVSLNIFKQHPFFGVGTGSFTHSYEDMSPTHSTSNNAQAQYLQTSVELGILGVVCLLIYLFQQLRWSFYLLPQERHFAVGLLVVQAVSFITLASLMDTTESHLFALFVAIFFSGLSCGRVRND